MTQVNVDTIRQSILDYVNNELYEDGTEVEADDDLLIDIGMDSLSLLMLIGFIESEYSISISPALITITNFRSVDIMSEFLWTLINKST